jgi:phosphoglycolate phosphatase
MIKYKYVLFDLDGTISQSAEGIRYSMEKTLEVIGKTMPDINNYTLYIGPPLLDTFRNLCGCSEEEGRAAVEVYRDFYNTTGKYMNKLYDGMEELLAKIKEQNVKVAVCSSKYEKFTQEVCAMLKVEQYFDAICGSTLDGKRKDKKDLIPYAVSSLGGDLESEKDAVVMIGDTYFDARGAWQCGVDFIGAAYGYGSLEQMKEDKATQFANSASEIYKFLEK